MVWREGNTAVVGRYGQPEHPDVAYARRVDYASACALLVRRRAWDDVGGFDEDFFPAYYEDADLCLQLRHRGWEVWYTPAARVVHAESVTAGSAKADMFRASEATFLQKWSARWATRSPTAATRRAGWPPPPPVHVAGAGVCWSSTNWRPGRAWGPATAGC